MSTIGQQMDKATRKAMNEAAVESNYHNGKFFAPIEYKADGEDDLLKPVKFQGFANTGKADLGYDIVEPEAFTNATLGEFLKFGRQLFFMHDPFSQVGEITDAKRKAKGTRNQFGVTDGGLWVEGFVDSPIDAELGVVPDHPLAKIIHFARMQVKRNRLKLLSIGWRPTRTQIIKAPDPRINGRMANFRKVTGLILNEVSLVTMAMNPQSITELRKAYEGAWGEEVTDALFAEGLGADIVERIPEKVDDLNEERVRQLVVGAAAKAKGLMLSKEPNKPDNADPKYKVISLQDRIETKFKIVSLD